MLADAGEREKGMFQYVFVCAVAGSNAWAG
jgi:hypothetical protein